VDPRNPTKERANEIQIEGAVQAMPGQTSPEAFGQACIATVPGTAFSSTSPREYGSIAEWNCPKGFGWVSTQQGFKLFAHKSDFLTQFADGYEPHPGTPVSFSRGLDPRNPSKERALEIQFEAGSENSYPGAGSHFVQGQTGHGYAHAITDTYSHMSGVREQGSVMEWNSVKGFGWIGTQQGFKLFAHKSDFLTPFAMEPPQGTPVSFVRGTDPRNPTKERAQEIQFETYGNQPPEMLAAQPAIAAIAAVPIYTPSAQHDPPSFHYDGQREHGTLKEWNTAKGFGWIGTQSGAKLFAHKSEFLQSFVDGQEPLPGTPLTFAYGTDPKNPNKERATAIQVEGPAPAMQEIQQDGVRFHGHVSKWTPSKACGWIASTDEPGKMYFAHKSDFVQNFPDTMQPAAGATVTYVPGHDPKSGKERATNIHMDQGDAALVVATPDGQTSGGPAGMPMADAGYSNAAGMAPMSTVGTGGMAHHAVQQQPMQHQFCPQQSMQPQPTQPQPAQYNGLLQ